MKIKLSFLLIILLTVNVYSQYDWTQGKLVLKSGETLKGLIKIPTANRGILPFGNSKLLFKKNKKSTKKKYGHNQVDKVFIGQYKKETGYYEYLPITRKRKGLFKLIIKGKINLYTRVAIIHNSNKTGNYYSSEKKKLKEYYVIRDSEEVAYPLISVNASISFKIKALDYFYDCEKIQSYIENDLYSEYDIIELIEDYNLLCE